MGDVFSALIAALVSLGLWWLRDQKEKITKAENHHREEVGEDVAVRLREIDAVEEFRDQLRETIRDQQTRIERLERELERARQERLNHERERLQWYQERLNLRQRLRVLESLLHVNEIDFPSEAGGT